jgi:hypothetical protein
MASHPNDDNEAFAAQWGFARRNGVTKRPQPVSQKLWPIFERRRAQSPASPTRESESDEKEEDDQSDSHSDFEDFSDGSNSEFDYDSGQDNVDPIEREIDRNNRLFKIDEDGEVEWYIQESVYTKQGWDRRGQYSRKFLYSSSSPEELRQYVKDRNLPDPYPQGITLK